MKENKIAIEVALETRKLKRDKRFLKDLTQRKKMLEKERRELDKGLDMINADLKELDNANS